MENLICRLGQLVTRERVIVYSGAYLVFTICAYLFAVFTGNGLIDRNGNVLGTDFLQFYSAGWLIAEGRGAQLLQFVPPFQFPAQAEIERIVLNPQSLPAQHAYVLPPFYALLFVPLSRLPYASAYLVWLLATVALYVASLVLLTPHCRILRASHARPAFLVALAFPPFLECLMDGQNAVTSLFLIVLTFVLLQQGRNAAAGVALGFLVYKPQLAIVILLFFLVTGRVRSLLSFSLVAVLLGTLSVALIGPDGVRDYLALSATMMDWPFVVSGFRTWNMHSLYSLFVLLIGQPEPARVLTVVASLVVVGSLVFVWRTARSLSSSFELASLASVLVSPHVFGYDLILLLVPGIIIAGDVADRGQSDTALERLLLVLLFVGAVVSKFLAMLIGLQVSALLIVSLFAVRVRRALASDFRNRSPLEGELA